MIKEHNQTILTDCKKIPNSNSLCGHVYSFRREIDQQLTFSLNFKYEDRSLCCINLNEWNCLATNFCATNPLSLTCTVDYSNEWIKYVGHPNLFSNVFKNKYHINVNLPKGKKITFDRQSRKYVGSKINSNHIWPWKVWMDSHLFKLSIFDYYFVLCDNSI